MSANNNQLNENHGIAATGLQNPHTAVPPTTYDDKAGTNNPSKTNRHAGTGIPPVNTAQHAEHNISKENQVNLDDTTARIGRDAYPPTSEHISHSEGKAVTGNHPTTSTGPEVPTTSTGPEVPTTSTGPEVQTGHVGDDKKQTPTATGQHPTSSDGVEATKPSTGDKIKGKIEKIAGKITGNEEKVIKGDNLVNGRA